MPSEYYIDLRVQLKKTYGDLLTKDILDFAANYRDEVVETVVQSLVALKYAGLLTPDILDEIIKATHKNYYNIILMRTANALLSLPAYGIPLTIIAQVAIIKAGFLSINVAALLIKLKSLGIQLKDAFIVDIADNKNVHTAIILNALATLHHAEIPLTDAIIGSIIKAEDKAMNVAAGFIILKRVRLPVSDETVASVSASFQEEVNNIANAIIKRIEVEDQINKVAKDLFQQCIDLNCCFMLPPVILNLTMSYFNPTEKTNSNIPVELALPTGIPMQIASVSPLTTEYPEQPMLTQVNAINSIPAISLPEETWMLGGLQDFTTQPTESKERSTLFPLSGFRLKVVETQLFFKNVRFPTADQQATAAVPRNDSAKANNLTCLPDKFYFSLGS